MNTWSIIDHLRKETRKQGETDLVVLCPRVLNQIVNLASHTQSVKTPLNL
ncbi:hypothetical protein AALP_AA5G143700 [Arabis alpina]|uniref:Uncharacterized protein n=1 Tax=Arabis alpina TaxID=50452 RepID=A0A087GX27_ARAAL|nr:hypothetical protein AALP_AA5G143700 [Arabis alpina]